MNAADRKARLTARTPERQSLLVECLRVLVTDLMSTGLHSDALMAIEISRPIHVELPPDEEAVIVARIREAATATAETTN